MRSRQIAIAVEDGLSEVVLRAVIRQHGYFTVVRCEMKGGQGFLKKNIKIFNNASRSLPYLVLTDLDALPCPGSLLEKWISFKTNPCFCFRIAVREVESWLLADRDSLAGFLKVVPARIPMDSESIADPKKLLVNLAARSKSKSIREDVAPPPGSTMTVGPDYNYRLSEFVNRCWNVNAAMASSKSLQKLYESLETLKERTP